MTIRETLAAGSAALKASGIKTAPLDASLLLAEILKCGRLTLTSAGLEQLSESDYNKFFELIRRRRSGECVAYILGKKEFYGLEFALNSSVLVPRPDTETLVETALEKLKQPGWNSGIGGASADGNTTISVLDLCTGSGAAAIALKHEMPELDVWASDISHNALNIAQINAKRLLPAHSSIHFRQGHLFEALISNCADLQKQSLNTPPPLFSLIVSNPPYIPSPEIAGLAPEVQNEPRLALDGGPDGLDIIRDIIRNAPDFLTPGGALLLEADPRQMKEITALLENNGFCDTRIYQDLSGQQRVIGALTANGTE